MVNYWVLKTEKNPCPVCGYSMAYPPRDFHICPSCGTEFGYHDSRRTYGELRRLWIESGARWWSSNRPAPARWSPWEQLVEAGYIAITSNTPMATKATLGTPISEFLLSVS